MEYTHQQQPSILNPQPLMLYYEIFKALTVDAPRIEHMFHVLFSGCSLRESSALGYHYKHLKRFHTPFVVMKS